MSEAIRKKFIVRGKVQMVGYRDFAQSVARTRRVNGYVRNADDGAVEVVAEGSAEDVAALKNDLAAGPPSAHVEAIEETLEHPTGMFNGFRIEY